MKVIKNQDATFLHINNDNIVANGHSVDEEQSILETVSDAVRPLCLPVGIDFVEQHTYRHATWSTVITLQIYKDDRWNEFRVRNIVNSEDHNCIDTTYRNRTVDDVRILVARQIERDTTF